MIVSVVISWIALLLYGGLLILVVHYGSGENRPRQLFSLYLLNMLLLQVAYLMISLADSEQEALLWYTFHVALTSAQAVSFFFFTLAFLERKPPRKWVLVVIFAWLLAVFGAFLYPGVIFAGIYRGAGTGLLVPEFSLLGVVFLMPMLLFWGLAVFHLGRGYRNTQSLLMRARIQYVSLSILIVLAGFIANVWPVLRPYPVDVVSNIVGAFLIAYGILRYQLLDITIVIRKSLSYVVSIVFFGTGYFFTILVSTQFLQNLTVLQIFLLSFATAVVGVVLSRPVVNRVQLWIDRIFFREKYSGTLMIQRLSRTATSVLDPEKLTGMILDDLTQTLHIRWAAFFLEQEGTFRLLAQRGLDTVTDVDLCSDHPIIRWLSNRKTTMTIDTLQDLQAQKVLSPFQIDELKRIDTRMFIPLIARDRLVGMLGTGPRLSERGYAQDDEVTLSTLANQVAIAVDNARLYAAVQRELTERRRAEVERERLIAELEFKNAELERFTYTVSHDLKSPLITIKGFLGFLEQDIARGNAERIKGDIAFITDAADKMYQLLSELLELSRIGWRANPPQSVSMTELAQEAANLITGQLAERGVQLDITPDMPTVFGDRSRLTEVFQNLISNAAKYMGDQPQPRVEVGVRQDDAQTVFYVRDKGVGIEPQYHDKVFELFEKLDSQSEGTGIGLAIVKRIIETHGGRIWVESSGAGHGSTFYFTLGTQASA
jgi:signal transduction histidine kinase